MMKLAFVYDRLNKVGGAEHVLQALHLRWPDAPWYTAVYNPDKAPFAKGWDVRTSPLQQVPYIRSHHELVPFLMPYFFESIDFSPYDLVVSISSAEGKCVLTGPSTIHLNYCLTPTRYLWSHAQEYLESRQFALLKGMFPHLIRILQDKLRRWDKTAAFRPDEMITISEHVKKRVKMYYNRTAKVVYPPVDVAYWSSLGSNTPNERDYYLIVSRLVPYKRIDLVVEAFNKLGKKLVVIGTGSEERSLRRLAGPTVTIKGFLPQEQVRGYYQHARAFIQANEEDFGISMVEAQAAGIPVVAYGSGGALEILTPETGVFFAKSEPFAIIEAVRQLETRAFDPEKCRRNAWRFETSRFIKSFEERVEQVWKIHKTRTQ